MLKIIRTNRISDGVVRIQFVAGEAALQQDNFEAQIIEDLQTSWGVEVEKITLTADKFFDGYKQGEKLVNQLQKQILVNNVKNRNLGKMNVFDVTETAPTRYLTEVGEALTLLKQKLQCQMLFVGDNFAVLFC